MDTVFVNNDFDSSASTGIPSSSPNDGFTQNYSILPRNIQQGSPLKVPDTSSSVFSNDEGKISQVSSGKRTRTEIDGPSEGSGPPKRMACIECRQQKVGISL